MQQKKNPLEEIYRTHFHSKITYENKQRLNFTTNKKLDPKKISPDPSDSEIYQILKENQWSDEASLLQTLAHLLEPTQFADFIYHASAPDYNACSLAIIGVLPERKIFEIIKALANKEVKEKSLDINTAGRERSMRLTLIRMMRGLPSNQWKDKALKYSEENTIVHKILKTEFDPKDPDNRPNLTIKLFIQAFINLVLLHAKGITFSQLGNKYDSYIKTHIHNLCQIEEMRNLIHDFYIILFNEKNISVWPKHAKDYSALTYQIWHNYFSNPAGENEKLSEETITEKALEKVGGVVILRILNDMLIKCLSLDEMQKEMGGHPLDVFLRCLNHIWNSANELLANHIATNKLEETIRKRQEKDLENPLILGNLAQKPEYYKKLMTNFLKKISSSFTELQYDAMPLAGNNIAINKITSPEFNAQYKEQINFLMLSILNPNLKNSQLQQEKVDSTSEEIEEKTEEEEKEETDVKEPKKIDKHKKSRPVVHKRKTMVTAPIIVEDSSSRVRSGTVAGEKSPIFPRRITKCNSLEDVLPSHAKLSDTTSMSSAIYVKPTKEEEKPSASNSPKKQIDPKLSTSTAAFKTSLRRGTNFLSSVKKSGLLIPAGGKEDGRETKGKNNVGSKRK